MSLEVEKRKSTSFAALPPVDAALIAKGGQSQSGTGKVRTGLGGIDGDHRLEGLPKRQEGELDHTERSRRTRMRLGTRGADLARYGITPEKVRVETTPGLSLESLGVDKQTLLQKLVQAHEHARKNQLLGNLSGRFFSSNLLLANGKWGIGTNIENSRDVGALCGERSAMITAWNGALQGIDLQDLEKGGTGPDLSVKLIVLSSSKEIGTDGAAVCPCAECQSWMATDQYWGPDTVVAGVTKDPHDDALVLKLQQVKDLLPVHTAVQVRRPSGPLQDLPIRSSEAAGKVMRNKGIESEQLLKALEAAKKAGSNSSTSEFSGVFDAAATLMSDGSIFDGVRFDWTARWTDPADLKAASDGVVFLRKRNQAANIDAVAYYGDKPPSVYSLGVLGQPTRGGPDTLVVTVEGNGERDQIQVRTILDLMPNLYISSSAAKQREAIEKVGNLVRELAGSEPVTRGASQADMRPEPPRHQISLPPGGATQAIKRRHTTSIAPGARSLQAGERISADGPELKGRATLTLELIEATRVSKVKDLDDGVMKKAGFGNRMDLMKKLNLKPGSTVTVFAHELDSIRPASGN